VRPKAQISYIFLNKEGEYTMSAESITTDESNEFAFEFLNEIIPHYAANPEWRDIFNDLANISEKERRGMLQRLETVPSDLVSKEQLALALAFLRLNLESPNSPRMMVKIIDYVNQQEGIA